MIAQPRALDTVVNTGWKIMLPPVSNLSQNMTATVLDAVAHKVNIVILKHSKCQVHFKILVPCYQSLYLDSQLGLRHHVDSKKDNIIVSKSFPSHLDSLLSSFSLARYKYELE